MDAVELMALAKLYQRPMAYLTDESYSISLEEQDPVRARKYAQLSENDQQELIKFAEFLAMRART